MTQQNLLLCRTFAQKMINEPPLRSLIAGVFGMRTWTSRLSIRDDSPSCFGNTLAARLPGDAHGGAWYDLC
jgi:hypothetical protein